MSQLHGKQIKDHSITQEKLNLLTPTSGDTQAAATVGYVNSATSNLENEKVNRSGDVMTGGLTVPNLTIQGTYITQQENLNVVSGTTNVICLLPNMFSAVFFDYLLTDGTSSRVGTVMVVKSTEIRFSEVSTKDINDTSKVFLSVDEDNGFIRLLTTVNDINTWSIKVHVRTF